MNWPALRAARAHDARLRVAFLIDETLVGSVARQHLPALHAWPEAMLIDERGVTLISRAEERDATLATINAVLHQRGLITGWRDECYTATELHSGRVLARLERAAARFWGTRTYGAHATGYVANTQGQPTHLWIAQRALNKATDPGLHDNLVGGGVPSHQSPYEALLREGFEEAGLDETRMRTVTPGRVMQLLRDLPEGLQREDLHSFDLQLPQGLQPANQDGEVQGFACLPVAEALALAAGSTMTVDAALVTLDFALRHGLLPPAEAAALAPQLELLFAAPDLGDQTA